MELTRHNPDLRCLHSWSGKFHSCEPVRLTVRLVLEGALLTLFLVNSNVLDFEQSALAQSRLTLRLVAASGVLAGPAFLLALNQCIALLSGWISVPIWEPK